MLKRATIIKCSDADAAVALPYTQTPVRRGTVVRRAVVEAQERASATLAQANKQAHEITAAAEREAAAVKQQAFQAGRAEGYAEAVARSAIVGQMEAAADERALARTISLARLLAERLLGKSLQLDESLVVAIGQQALKEMKGVRQVRLLASPDDVAVLQAQLPEPHAGFSVSPEPTLSRGDFRLITDVGTIDATLGDRLDLLATKLHDSLKKGA